MKTAVKLALFFGFLMTLQGCFPGFKEEKSQDRDYDKIQKLKILYGNYQGTYRGDLVNGDKRVPMVLNIVVGEVQNGYYSDGAQKFLPQLNVSFIRSDDAGSIATQLTGTVADPEQSKDTTATFKIVENTPNDYSIASISGTFTGDHFAGEIVTLPGQILGKFDLTKQDQHDPAPVEGDFEAKNTRLREAFTAIKGTYKGNLATDHGDIPLRVRIFFDEVTDSTGKTHPELRARYRRMDLASPTFPLAGTYVQIDSNALTFKAGASTDPALDLNLMNFFGHISDTTDQGRATKLYKGTVTLNSQGQSAVSFELIRQAQDDPEDIDSDEQYKNELLRVYAGFRGTYKGEIKIGETKVPIRVRVNSKEELDPATGKNRAMLIASFRRMDVPSYEFDLKGMYKQDRRQLILSRTPTGTDANIDLNILNFNGVMDERLKYSGQLTFLTAGSESFELTKQDHDDPVPADADEAYKQEWIKVYESIRGSYSGTLSTEIGKIPIRVRLSYKEGLDKNTVQVLGTYRRVDIPSREFDLKGTYRPELGQLILTREASSTDANFDLNIISFSGRLDPKKSYGGIVTYADAGGAPAFQLIKDEKEETVLPDPEEQYKAELEKVFLSIKGTYKGDVRSEGRAVPVRLQIFYRQVLSNDGKYTPTLFGSFRRTDVASPEFYLQSIYRPELHQIVFTNPKSATDNLDLNIVNFEGSLQIQEIDGKPTMEYVGQAKRQDNGNLDFQLLRQAKEDAIPADGSNEQYKRELQAQLQVFTGKWYGKVDFPKDSHFKDMKIQLDLQVRLDMVNGIADFPQLVATHNKVGDDPALVFRQVMTVNYDPTVLPAKITFNGHSWKPQSPYFVNITGTYTNIKGEQVITGTWSDFQNNVIPIKLTR